LAAFALAAAVVLEGAFAAGFLAGARVFLGGITSSTESSSSSDPSSNYCQLRVGTIRLSQLTNACLPLGLAFGLAFDEEPFLAGMLDASESRSILLYQLCKGWKFDEHTDHPPQLSVSLIRWFG
jgi:hypothetical protein